MTPTKPMPLTAEERRHIVERSHGWFGPVSGEAAQMWVERYEATVQHLEAIVQHLEAHIRELEAENAKLLKAGFEVAGKLELCKCAERAEEIEGD